MATTLTSPVFSKRTQSEVSKREQGLAVALVTALTFAGLLIHGYHPYAEDGGVYMPEVKRLVDPTLYPHGADFVVEHLHFSLFAPLMAALVRRSDMSVEALFLLVYIMSFWATLFAAWMLAAKCYSSRTARIGAVTLLAVWMTLPVAGTSLMLMDPYLTARSVATPCTLFALIGALEFLLREDEINRRWGLVACCASLMGAVAMHPLMGGYAVGTVLLLWAALLPTRSGRIWSTMGLGVTAVAVAAGLVLAAPQESDICRQVDLTRYYWFLGRWHWYELMGLIAPLMILSVVALGRRHEADRARVGLAWMALAGGGTAIVVAALFARAEMTTHVVARLQPLRAFQLVYVVMILTLGATVAERVLQRRPMRWIAVFSLLGGVMVYAERMTFPASKHLELPSPWVWHDGSSKENQWEKAFVWIRRATPKDALFALDARYISEPGEDAQSFRAIAERNALPDFSKDGGIVTNKPELAMMWLEGQRVQTELNAETDVRRVATLKPLGVGWLVLERAAITSFPCVYTNETVKVCRLP